MNRFYSQSERYPQRKAPHDPCRPVFSGRFEDGGQNRKGGSVGFTVRVADAATGSGLHGAVVRPSQPDGASYAAVSDAQGVIEFSPPHPGRYQPVEEMPPEPPMPTAARHGMEADHLRNVGVNGVPAHDFAIRNAPPPVVKGALQAHAADPIDMPPTMIIPPERAEETVAAPLETSLAVAEPGDAGNETPSPPAEPRQAIATGKWISCANRIVLVEGNSHTGDFDSPVEEVGIKYAYGDPDMERHAMMNGTVGSPFDVYIPVHGGPWYYAAFVKTANGDIFCGKTESARYP